MLYRQCFTFGFVLLNIIAPACYAQEAAVGASIGRSGPCTYKALYPSISTTNDRNKCAVTCYYSLDPADLLKPNCPGSGAVSHSCVTPKSFTVFVPSGPAPGFYCSTDQAKGACPDKNSGTFTETCITTANLEDSSMELGLTYDTQ